MQRSRPSAEMPQPFCSYPAAFKTSAFMHGTWRPFRLAWHWRIVQTGVILSVREGGQVFVSRSVVLYLRSDCSHTAARKTPDRQTVLGSDTIFKWICYVSTDGPFVRADRRILLFRVFPDSAPNAGPWRDLACWHRVKETFVLMNEVRWRRERKTLPEQGMTYIRDTLSLVKI